MTTMALYFRDWRYPRKQWSAYTGLTTKDNSLYSHAPYSVETCMPYSYTSPYSICAFFASTIASFPVKHQVAEINEYSTTGHHTTGCFFKSDSSIHILHRCYLPPYKFTTANLHPVTAMVAFCAWPDDWPLLIFSQCAFRCRLTKAIDKHIEAYISISSAMRVTLYDIRDILGLCQPSKR